MIVRINELVRGWFVVDEVPASRSELAVQLRRLLLDRERATGQRLKRSALARAVGVSPSSLYAYLNGSTLPPADILDRLLVECRVPAGQQKRLATARDELELSIAKAAPRPERLVPRQLPLDPGQLSGRSAALAELTAVLDPESEAPPARVAVICGLGGIGKTTLTVHWAHRSADLFPDGQLFADLHGFDPARRPASAETVMRSFLDALGVPVSSLPVEPEALAAHYRSALADRRLLIVLDNARDAAHVAPLLPGSNTSRVLVTGRERLNGLVVTHGARLVVLDVLDEGSAMELLTRHLGAGRVDAEPAAARELVAACAGLPLAVAILASRAAASPDLPLSELLDQLRTAVGRLDTLDAGGGPASLSAVLSSSYRTLDAPIARLFRLLGAAPLAGVGTAAAASLAGESMPVTARRLRALMDSTFLRQSANDRFVMHELVRAYAADRAARDEPPDSLDLALRRLAAHYLHSAAAGDRLLAPSRKPVALAPPEEGSVVLQPADVAAVLTWFGNEQRTLMAVQSLAAELGWHSIVWQLAWATDNFHYRRGHVHDHVTAWRRGLEAAQATGDIPSQILAYRRLGAVCGRAGNPDEALEFLRLGLDLARSQHDTENEAALHQDVAVALGQRNEPEAALRSSIRAVELYRGLGNVGCEAIALNNVGWFYAQTGNYEQAREHCQQALARHEQRGDEEARAGTLDSLGFIANADGRHTDAIELYQSALAAVRAIGHSYGEANALAGLAEAYLGAGRSADARSAWTQALLLYQRQRRMAEAESAKCRLAAIDQRG